jgi:tetratricopeptide (TPR) repeat protein
LKTQQFIPLLVIAAGLVAYHNSFTGAFIFDDRGSIVDNRTIRQLWPLGPVLTKADYATVVSRPLLNLSLAINYALGGTNSLGYHVVNIAVHVLAGLALFGVLRRTFRLPSLQGHLLSRAPTGLALTATLLWTVHPLQTESVTYVCQRAESLAGLFYLLVFYSVLRAVDSPYPHRWYGLAVLACWLGVTTKETLVTAPLLLLFYDRFFLTTSWKTSIQSRWALYLGLASSWILLALLMFHSGGRANSAGFGRGMSAWEYACTQPYYIVHYLMLGFWPKSLVLDYGMYVAKRPAEIIPYTLIIGALVVATLWCLRVSPKLGYCGLWFFGTLAPTSSFVPLITQTGAEHRMYLPLAALVVLVVTGSYELLTFTGRNAHMPKRWRRHIAYSVVGVLVVALGWLTVRRNEDYRSELSIWADTVAKRPANWRALGSLGEALARAGKVTDAIRCWEQALRLEPDLAEAHNNLGIALHRAGKVQEAIEQYEEALRIKPDYADAHNNLGSVLMELGRTSEARGHFEQALRIKPDYGDAHCNLGSVLTRQGRLPEAISHFDQALHINPDFAKAHNNLGVVLMSQGRLQAAIDQYEQALHIDPDYAEAHFNLGSALQRAGQIKKAIEHYEQALRINPDFAQAQRNLARARAVQ